MRKASALRSMPRNVWILGLASMLTDTSSEMIHCLLPMFLVVSLGASVTIVGLIEGIAESIASVMKLLSGVLSDYLGRRKILVVAGYGLSTAVKPLFALAQNPLWILFARTTDRMGKGVRGAPRDALVADSVPPESRGAAYGLRQSLDTAGAFLGPLTAFVLMLLSHSNYRFIFWCAVVPAVAAVLLLVVGVEERKGTKKVAVRNPLEWQALRRLGKQYWILVAAALIFNLGNSSDAFLLLRTKQLGITDDFIPLSVVVMNFTYTLSAYPLGALSDRIGRFGLLTGGFVLYALVYAGFALANAAWQTWLLFAVYGLYLGMSQGVLLAMVADKVPEDQRGTAFGFVNLATGITLLPASLVAGMLWDKVSPAAPFLLGAVFALVAALFLIIGLKLTEPIDKTA